MREWILGVDGGGTSSRIRVESMAGDLLYHGSDGSTNPNSNEGSAVAAVLRRLISGAFESGLDPLGCRAGFIGSAGVDLESDRATMAAAMRSAFREMAGTQSVSPAFAAGNDAEPALAGALGDVEGFLLLAGTGSIAYGRTRSGQSARSGGWGHFLGDEGSAFFLAFEALKRGIRSSEGRDAPTALLETALEHFDLPDARALIPFTYQSFDKARIASFAPFVVEAAEAGDELGLSIVEAAATELVSLVTSVYDRLARGMESTRLALYGGLLEKNFALRKMVVAKIAASRPRLAIVVPAGDAQAGACRLARELLA